MSRISLLSYYTLLYRGLAAQWVSQLRIGLFFSLIKAIASSVVAVVYQRRESNWRQIDSSAEQPFSNNDRIRPADSNSQMFKKRRIGRTLQLRASICPLVRRLDNMAESSRSHSRSSIPTTRWMNIIYHSSHTHKRAGRFHLASFCIPSLWHLHLACFSWRCNSIKCKWRASGWLAAVEAEAGREAWMNGLWILVVGGGADLILTANASVELSPGFGSRSRGSELGARSSKAPFSAVLSPVDVEFIHMNDDGDDRTGCYARMGEHRLAVFFNGTGAPVAIIETNNNNNEWHLNRKWRKLMLLLGHCFQPTLCSQNNKPIDLVANEIWLFIDFKGTIREDKREKKARSTRGSCLALWSGARSQWYPAFEPLHWLSQRRT